MPPASNNPSQSEKLYALAERHIIGGVNSPSRSLKAVGIDSPVFMQRAEGAYLWDVDGNRYVDYQAAFGPIIAGHAHPHIVQAICEAAREGTLYGTSTAWEVKLARMLQQAIPSLERIRFVNSGTEAVMTTIRVARAYTGRDKVIKFAGCYHGHSDLVLVAAGSGPSTLGVPDSAGIPRSLAQEVITVPFNNLEALERSLSSWGKETAAILVEPIVGNFGIVLPEKGFLEGIRDLARRYGALVIYDEVITAFRFTYGGAQNLLGVEPDLTALGKIIGGGLPIGAYGGKREIMEQVSPLGPAYQAGTMAGNPASIRSGIACLEVLQDKEGYQRMARFAAQLEKCIVETAEHFALPVVVNRLAGALTVFFSSRPIRNYADAQEASSERFAFFFRQMLSQGIYLAPSKYEAWFLTLSHSQEDIIQTMKAVKTAFANFKRL